MTIISISWLSISGPLAIISMVSITTISVANMSIAISMTISISWLSSGSWLGISVSSWLGIARSLAIISMGTIAISMTISKTMSMAIITISRLGLSRPLAIVTMVTISISMTIIAISRLGNSHTQEGKRNSNQKFHVVSSSFSTTLFHDHNSHILARQQPYP